MEMMSTEAEAGVGGGEEEEEAAAAASASVSGEAAGAVRREKMPTPPRADGAPRAASS